jgi:hypothetical protein
MKHGEILKNLFLIWAAKSSWPQITKDSFAEACQDWGVVCKKHLPVSYCDIAQFEALANESKFEGGKIKNRMCRFEFFEAIMRVAKRRFLESGDQKTVGEAL